MQIRYAVLVGASPEAVTAVIGSPEFHMFRIRRDPATVDVISERLPDGAHRIRVTQRRRTATGGLDKSATDPATQELRWSRPGELSWTWVQGGRFAITLRGRFRVSAEGAGSRVETESDVEIGIPLVGRVLERVVASELEKNNASLKEDLLARLAAG